MIGIIEYGAGNIFSLTASLERLGLSYKIISKVEQLSSDEFDRFIVPGVGHAATAKNKLKNTSKLWEAIPQIKKPLLGICVGLQLMTKHSEEGDVSLLGIFEAKTKKFLATKDEKVPHMGWNKVESVSNHLIFADLENGAYFYFVHSYYVENIENSTIGRCDYIQPFSAAIAKDNFIGVQFHPEKSGEAGMKLLQNFSRI